MRERERAVESECVLTEEEELAVVWVRCSCFSGQKCPEIRIERVGLDVAALCVLYPERLTGVGVWVCSNESDPVG